ncbi:transcriptional regulator [[Eubacterium] cellulosolvens]
MKPPCVTIVKYLLPAIRVLVMKELIEKHNMRKIDVSDKMDLTPAAITQYLKGKRGNLFVEEIEDSQEAMMMISKLSDALAKKDTSIDIIIERLCNICTSIRSEGIVCKLHQKDLPALKECKNPICKI